MSAPSPMPRPRPDTLAPDDAARRSDEMMLDRLQHDAFDYFLKNTNPHNGLDRYLSGLGRLVLEEGVKHVLPAHYDPVVDLRARIHEIANDHVEKLRLTMTTTKNAGATLADVSSALFGKQEGYNVLLALLEAGTHVEYLHQLGALVVTDLDALVENPRLPFRYQATDVVDAAGADGPSFGVKLGGG